MPEQFTGKVYFNEEYGIFVAECDQTGSMGTADDKETAESMLAEILEDETKYYN